MNAEETARNQNTKNGAGKKDGTQPVHIVRRGAVAASVWKRQANSGYAYYNFTISRSWKSVASEKTGYSTNFFAKNEQDLQDVIKETCGWISAREMEDKASPSQGAIAA